VETRMHIGSQYLEATCETSSRNTKCVKYRP